MDLNLKDKHVLIAGGSRGIGHACAHEFVREGCIVSLIGRSASRLEEACAELGAGAGRSGGFAADLTDPAAALAAIETAEKRFGPIDVLVNSAGAARRMPFAELQPRDWHDAMQAKFLTYMNVMDPVVKRMGARGAGAIVNIVGMGGKMPITTHLAGGAANAALMLASAGLAMAYAPMGVRVNALNPAKTATARLAEGVEAHARQAGTTVEALMQEQARLPMGLATPQDVAAAVVFLASPRAKFISGSIISMDGGARPMVV
ncbi:SDR family oxidoreductase [Polaromonas sp. P1(28)-13]|nr:SDR family oxidoreductase [Polaromonas sp. P1(28)-13]